MSKEVKSKSPKPIGKGDIHKGARDSKVLVKNGAQSAPPPTTSQTGKKGK